MAYSNADEIEYFKWQFIQDAFYNGGEYLVGQAKVDIRTDLYIFRISQYDFSFDWWQKYIDFEFIGKMIFHNTGGEDKTYYFFEALPIIIDEKGITLTGRSIRATCLQLLHEVTDIPVTIYKHY